MLHKIKKYICRPVEIENKWKHAIVSLSVVGFFDTSYLTYSHFKSQILSCFGHTIVNGCQVVTESIYSTVLGVPIALVGLGYYTFIIVAALLSYKRKFNFLLNSILPITALAVLFSLRLTYLQIAVINYICYYCILSAALSVILFGISWKIYKKISLLD